MGLADQRGPHNPPQSWGAILRNATRLQPQPKDAPEHFGHRPSGRVRLFLGLVYRVHFFTFTKMNMIKIIDSKGKEVPHVMRFLSLGAFEKTTPDDFHRCGHCLKIVTIQDSIGHQCPESIRDFYQEQGYLELAKRLLTSDDSFKLKVEIDCFMLEKDIDFDPFNPKPKK